MDWWISFFSAAVIAGTPLLFATLGAIFNERAGHTNLGVEGMMILGAVLGFAVAQYTANGPLAMLVAALAGAAGALIYAVLTVSLRSNHVVTGLTLTIFGTGLANFLGQGMVGNSTPQAVKAFFSTIAIPGLSKIPILGPVFFEKDIFVYCGYILVILSGLYLYRTRFGLNLRAVGENPAAADAASIPVNLYKYAHILFGGALCGLGGAYLSLVYVQSWQTGITAGQGWIAVALVIFCTWNPYKTFIAAYLFGGLSILGFRLQSAGIHVSQYLLDMVPYLVTIIILVFLSMGKGKNTAPKSLGNPYFREER
ncbi:MAG: ABC transporter permease [Peptococcaceae bacterium]|nr:ABC transporter permease [Peptococcaceae bacterium]